VGPRAGLDTEATGKILLSLPGIEHRKPGRQVRNQTLLTELPGSPFCSILENSMGMPVTSDNTLPLSLQKQNFKCEIVPVV
jgi:hypothetical protein